MTYPMHLLPTTVVGDLVDWILRILLSYAAVPGPADLQPADIRRQLRAWFLPAFDRFL